MFGGFINNAVAAVIDNTSIAHTETFESVNGVAPSPARVALVSFVTVVIMLSVLLFIGKYLWNNVMTELFTFAKPVKSIWQLLGLAILLSLFQPGGAQYA